MTLFLDKYILILILLIRLRWAHRWLDPDANEERTKFKRDEEYKLDCENKL